VKFTVTSTSKASSIVGQNRLTALFVGCELMSSDSQQSPQTGTGSSKVVPCELYKLYDWEKVPELYVIFHVISARSPTC